MSLKLDWMDRIEWAEGGRAKYESWQAANTDPYGAACMLFASTMMAGLQDGVNAGKEVGEIARDCETVADKAAGGITGFMYGAGISMISQAWKHGDALKDWHNGNYVPKDKVAGMKGVVNPALLTIGKD